MPKKQEKEDLMKKVVLFLSILVSIILLMSTMVPISSAQASNRLILTVQVGPDYDVEQSNPTDPNIIMIPAGDKEPLIIWATLTNLGADPFIGIPSSTYFTKAFGDQFFLSGVTGIVDGEEFYEGKGLTDVATVPPFIGGFVLGPGESKEFVFHVIYGLLCNGCAGIPGPPLVSAPCGETLSLLDSSMWIRSGVLVDGLIYSNPDMPPDIFLVSHGPYPLNVTVVCEATEIIIDIKPRSFPNSVNPKSKGVIPVAILGNSNLDVTIINVDSLRFGILDPGPGAEPTHNGHYDDVNGDGYMDLVVHFRTQATGIAKGDTEACLTGETYDETPISDCDAIRTVGKK